MGNRSSPESRLVEEAKHTFGAHLVSVLLAGYDEFGTVQVRCFEVLTQWHSFKTRNLLKIAIGDACGLPQGKEPLVLLALLKLLNSGSDLVEGSKVITPTEEICSILGWRVSSDTSALIDRAIRKYFLMSYLLAHDNRYSFPEMSGYSVSICRLIIACAFNNDSGTDDPFEGVGYSHIEFNQDLVQELRAANLLGMDWSRVTSLERQ